MAYNSRRRFTKLALASLGATALSGSQQLFAVEKPNSKFDGVQIGVIVPYSYHFMPNDAKSILGYLIRDNINAVEMMNSPVEEWAGAPAPPRDMFGGAAMQRGAPGSGMGPKAGAKRPQATPQQLEAREQYASEMTKWRLSTPVSKYEAFRKWYSDAGVSMYGFKIGLTEDMPDAEYDYAFGVTKTLGANQLTMELPTNPALTARVGKFADKYKIMVGYHAHLQAQPHAWDQAMAQSPYNGINLDIGHYVAAGNHDVLQFIQNNHARITSIHLKDRKYPEHDGNNMVWGQGDTPIKEVLQLVRTHGYKFPCTIELEYVPLAGSNSEKEVARCRAYAKAALTES